MNYVIVSRTEDGWTPTSWTNMVSQIPQPVPIEIARIALEMARKVAPNGEYEIKEVGK